MYNEAVIRLLDMKFIDAEERNTILFGNSTWFQSRAGVESLKNERHKKKAGLFCTSHSRIKTSSRLFTQIRFAVTVTLSANSLPPEFSFFTIRNTHLIADVTNGLNHSHLILRRWLNYLGLLL
jgi:hypothetical protein